jgi:hypothetical protein
MGGRAVETIIAVLLSLFFVVILLVSRNKWIVPAGFIVLFLAGTLMFLRLNYIELGFIDVSVAMMSVSSSIRNFFGNNDAGEYFAQAQFLDRLVINLICFLSMFMTAFGLIKVVFNKFSDTLYLLIHRRNRKICVFQSDNK